MILKKIAIVYWIIAILLALIALAFLIPFYVNSNVSIFGINKSKYIHQREKISSNQLKADSLFLKYNSLVSEYINQPSTELKSKILQTSAHLDDQLIKSWKLLGLNVKRPVNLFSIWKANFEAELFKSSANLQNQIWNYELLAYQHLIEKQMNISKTDFDVFLAEKLLYNYAAARKPSIDSEVEKLYAQNANQLMPQALESLQQKSTRGLAACLEPQPGSQEDDPKYIVDSVASIENSSIFCPFIIPSKAKSHCNQLRSFVVLNAGSKKWLNTQWTFCEIAHRNIDKAEKAALERYGNLSFSEYYQKYVTPLLPKNIQTFQEKVKTNEQNCSIKSLPVVPYRNPQIDAQTAAYEMKAFELCHNYFNENYNSLATLQQMRYKMKFKEQNG